MRFFLYFAGVLLLLVYQNRISILLFSILEGILLLFAQSPEQVSIEAWVTNPDRSDLFSKQETNIQFNNSGRRRGIGSVITIDDGIKMQSVDGFEFALTGGSAWLMMNMHPAERMKLIHELFRMDGNNIGVSYVSLIIGASDLNNFVFSYNDLGDSETEPNLDKFNLSQDRLSSYHTQ